MIWMLFSFVWASLFTGGDFNISDKTTSYTITITDLPHFNYNKYPELDVNNYYIEYEYQIWYFSNTVSNVVDYKVVKTTDTSITIPKIGNRVSVLVEVHPKGYKYEYGDGVSYLMGGKILVPLVPDKNGTLSSFWWN